MAVTAVQLSAALRLGDGLEAPDQPLLGILERLIAVANARVEKYAPDAPDDIKDLSEIRLAGYLFDMPQAPMGNRYAAAFRYSGAASLLAPWRVRRLGDSE